MPLALSEFITRPARLSDNIGQIAELIYGTDPFIYPFWLKGDRRRGLNMLKKLIKTPGTVFSLSNTFVLSDPRRDEIVGIVIAISSLTPLDYDYTRLKKVNKNYRFTIEHYIEPSIQEIRESAPYTTIVMNFCIRKTWRGQGLGRILLGDFIKFHENRGFRRFELDCLAANEPALRLYHDLDFQDVAQGIGFDGTESSQVQTVSLVREQPFP